VTQREPGSGCRGVDQAARLGPRPKGYQRNILQRAELDLAHTRQRMVVAQDHPQLANAEALRHELIGQIAKIADSKIRQTAADIVSDVVAEAFAKLDLDAGKPPSILGDDPTDRQFDQARDDDLAALPVG
jgi:hypothetical protein